MYPIDAIKVRSSHPSSMSINSLTRSKDKNANS